MDVLLEKTIGFVVTSSLTLKKSSEPVDIFLTIIMGTSLRGKTESLDSYSLLAIGISSSLSLSSLLPDFDFLESLRDSWLLERCSIECSLRARRNSRSLLMPLLKLPFGLLSVAKEPLEDESLASASYSSTSCN